MNTSRTYEELLQENEELRLQLEEATDTIEAIRTGQVDALVVKGPDEEHQLYTLKTADQNYRVFIEKMNEGAVTLNEGGLIVYCNTMFSLMVGTPLSGIIGTAFKSFIPADCLDTFHDIFQNGWFTDSKTEISLLNDEKRIPCQLSVTTLQLDEGPALSVIITDLSFQKETQQLLKSKNESLATINAELETSNHDLQQFASVASHDLQEPLRKILIFSTMLRDKHELSEKSAVFLEKIIASSERMRTMISDILSYSRLSTHDNRFALINLREVIREVLDDYEILIEEKNATINVGHLPEIEANRGQIKQVFQNLISNSIKFSQPDKAPIINISSCEVYSGTQCITVTDNGIGFDSQYREKIFSLFERLNTKDKFEGSGIGLAITKKIIDKHNGTITALSQDKEGASFRITLPVRQ
ncbi:ATP-binding protein [Persicitalea sp.]|uniref:sensor histidine kinase n=1 Tax=Persicitalea sp. TaxID=3100273 RepID=UPI0035939BE6